MTFEERVSAVESLAFTSRQARFIVTVALHGGFCMRRQYLQFSGLQYGKNVRDFLDGLIDRRLATRQCFLPNRGYIYHLHAKSLYRLIEQPENRNRRTTSSALMARRLMLLDVVLEKPDADWYATEDDKICLFMQRFGLSIEVLPRRVFKPARRGTPSTTRYFIDKLPICVTPDPPTVTFVYLQVDRTIAGFQHFLVDHAGLLAQLPSWRVFLACSPIVGPSRPYFGVFDRFKSGALLAASAPSALDLGWYFKALDMVERNDTSSLRMADIHRFHELRERTTAPHYRMLYREWLTRGDAALQAFCAGSQPTNGFAGGLIVYGLPSHYRQFGSLPGVA